MQKNVFFTSACALVGFVSNCSHGFDAILHPASDILHISHEAIIFQFLLCTFVTLIFSYPILRFGSQLTDSFDSNISWNLATVVSVIFFIFNLLITPRHYSTLHTNNMMKAFWIVVTLFFFLMLFLQVMFYHIVISSLEASQLSMRLRYLEMQESQYRKLQRYMEDTKKQRHDFRHTLRTLHSLATDGDIHSIKDYLADYLDKIPENDVTLFTKNIPVNTILNFYMESAKSAGIKLTWKITLDEHISWISDSDLCNILGNILDNAIIACTEATPPIPVSERFIDLYILSENNSTLYIVCANSFDGFTKKSSDGTYMSSHEHGSGIGLSSIRTTAENYNGTANFSHEGKEFYSEVMLRSPE